MGGLPEVKPLPAVNALTWQKGVLVDTEKYLYYNEKTK